MNKKKVSPNFEALNSFMEIVLKYRVCTYVNHVLLYYFY